MSSPKTKRSVPYKSYSPNEPGATNLEGWILRSLKVPFQTFQKELKWTTSQSVIQKPHTGSTIEPKMEIVEATREEVHVNLSRPMAPDVTYLEMVRFVIWGVLMVMTQAWRDLVEGRLFKPILSSDFATHYFYIPVGRHDPRVVTSGPHNRMTAKLIPPKVTRRFEEDCDLSLFKNVELVNCASNNYGGFSQLEYGAEKVIELALQKLPFAPAPATLELKVRNECAAYMKFDSCVTAPSGFSTNVLAFATAAGVARSLGRKLVFLCDRDCHNSMFTGAYLNKEARVHKFNHNDLNDLEYKLRMYHEQESSAFICVAVEGIYSMEGSISPGPALLGLKRAYNFTLLIDEAHSFMSLGSFGRGSFNHWEDAGFNCPSSEVDIMSCMFSKSVGCTGGFVLANGIFAAELRRQGEMLVARGVETLSTVVLFRVLNLLRKPLLIQHRMRLVREKAEYVSRALEKAGCRVLSSPSSPIICFSVGTARQVMFFHGEAMKMGMAIVGGVPPATPMWDCRVRLCVFATTTWPDIHRLLTTTVHIAQKIHVRGIRPTCFDPSLCARVDPAEEPGLKNECDLVDDHLVRYVDELSVAISTAKGPQKNLDELVVRAGIEGLRNYGIGPCSARWFYGSFDVFIELERRLASLYPSLIEQSGQCRAMICGDAEITISSTVTALVMRCASKKVVNQVFIPRNAPQGVTAGATLNRPSKNVEVTFFQSFDDIILMVDTLGGSSFHMTLYLQTVTNGVVLELVTLLRQLVPKLRNHRKLTGITIMLDDRHGLGKIGPQTLGFLNLMEATHGTQFLSKWLRQLPCAAQIIVAGSWFDAFGHQGGYVTGTASTVECLTWDAKAFFFSTPPMPLQAAMSNCMLRLLSEGHFHRDETDGSHICSN